MTKVISSLALLSTLLLISSYDCLKIRNKSSNPYYIPHTGNDPYDWYGEQLAKEGSSKSSNPYYIPHTGNDPYDWYGEQLVKKQGENKCQSDEWGCINGVQVCPPRLKELGVECTQKLGSAFSLIKQSIRNKDPRGGYGDFDFYRDFWF